MKLRTRIAAWFRNPKAKADGRLLRFSNHQRMIILYWCFIKVFSWRGVPTSTARWFSEGTWFALLAALLFLGRTLRFTFGPDGMRVNRHFLAWKDVASIKVTKRGSRPILRVTRKKKRFYWQSNHVIHLHSEDQPIAEAAVRLFESYQQSDAPDAPTALFRAASEYRDVQADDVPTETLEEVLRHPRSPRELRVRVAEVLSNRGEADVTRDVLEEVLCPETRKALLTASELPDS